MNPVAGWPRLVEDEVDHQSVVGRRKHHAFEAGRILADVRAKTEGTGHVAKGGDTTFERFRVVCEQVEVLRGPMA